MAIATIVLAPFSFILDRNSRPLMSWSITAKIMLLSLFDPVLDQNLYYMGMKHSSATVNVFEKVSLKKLHSIKKVMGTIITVGGAIILTLVKGPPLCLPWANDHHRSICTMQYSSDRPCERSSLYHRSLFMLVLLYHFVLPHVKEADYNAIQLIGVIEHKDYFTVGYRTTNLYTVSSRFGTPDDFKRLVDQAHGQGLLVFLEIVHSYSATDEMVGLALFD